MQPTGLALRKRIGRLQFHIDRLIGALTNAPAPRRVIFLHVPKCAGSTLNLVFKSYYGSGRSKRVAFINDGERGISRESVARARDALFVSGHFGVETLEQILGDAFVFTMLRDPYDRLRSTYGHFRTRTRRNPMQSRVLQMDLADFLCSEDPAILHWTDNVMARMLAARFDRSSVASLNRSELAALAIAHFDRFDYIGFVDSFDSDLERIVKLAGIRHQGTATRANVTAYRADVKPPEEAIVRFGASVGQMALPSVEADLAVYTAARRWRAGEGQRDYTSRSKEAALV